MAVLPHKWREELLFGNELTSEHLLTVGGTCPLHEYSPTGEGGSGWDISFAAKVCELACETLLSN